MKRTFQGLFVSSVLFSIAFLIVLSLGRNWSFPSLLPAIFTWDNWRLLLSTDGTLLTSLFQSLTISLVVALITTMAAFITSKHIANSAYRNKLLLLAYIPYVLSPVIIAATLHFFFIYGRLSGTLVGVMLAQFFIAYPFGVIILSNFWNPRIKAVEQLSYTLGSSAHYTWIKVLLPISRNALLLCFFQTFLVSWFEFGLTNLIGVGSVQTLTIKVFSFVNEANIFNAALASCLLIVPPMILIWINKRYIFNTQTAL